MKRGRANLVGAGLVAMSVAALSSPATAAGPRCRVIGDSVAVGLAAAMRGCASSAKVGISSTKSAAGARAGGGWVIASIGSNDFPKGINAAQQAQSEVRVRQALASAYAKAGSRLILILPANGARATVSAWAGANGVRTIAFQPGRDGIHPSNYAGLAQQVRGVIGN